MLDLLYPPSDSETNSWGAIRLLPEGLTSLIICMKVVQYTGSSKVLVETHPNFQPIRVIFERCPNILPSIREELSGELSDALSQFEIPSHWLAYFC